MPEPPTPDPEPDPEPEERLCWGLDTGRAIIASQQSTIDGLAGCEEMYGLQVLGPLDLRPLASLRRVGDGGLHLFDVEALDGLENLEQTERLALAGTSIQSLSQLSGLRRSGSLDVQGTSLVDFSGLENATGLFELVFRNNAQLESLAGLVLEGSMDIIELSSNPVLSDVTSLGGPREVHTLLIIGNPQLAALPPFSQLASADTFELIGMQALEVAPEFPLLTELRMLRVLNNSSLALAAFPALEVATELTITDNPNLVELDLPQLRQAETLIVHHNERLDGSVVAASLAGVSSFTHRVAPDQTQSALDPCPWTTDPYCDEGILCAGGTDPSCR